MERDNPNLPHGTAPVGLTTGGANKGESSNQDAAVAIPAPGIAVNDGNNTLNQANQQRPAVEAAVPVRGQEHHHMPMSNVLRIMRRVLPPNANISDDAKEAMQECVTEFIGFVTNEATERSRMELRKTIKAEDLIWAMGMLGFENYAELLTVYLNRYRESEGLIVSRATNLRPLRIAENAPPPPIFPPTVNDMEGNINLAPPMGNVVSGLGSTPGSSSSELALFPGHVPATDQSMLTSLDLHLGYAPQPSQESRLDSHVGSASSSSQAAKIAFDPFAGSSSAQANLDESDDPFTPLK